MSRQTKQVATSRRRRTTRADQPALSTIVSNNPIFFRGDDGRAEADPVPALVHEVVPAAVTKPLPLPPSRTRPQQSAGSAVVMSRHGSGWVLWRVPQHDPFLAAYVTCTKQSGGKVVDAAAPVKRRQQKKNETGGGSVMGCGIWSGWAAGAKYAAGLVSCKYACNVARPAAAVQSSPEPSRLHLSRQLVVIPARKRALARAQGQD